VLRRLPFNLLIVALVALVAAPASGAPRDAAAKKKIDEAVNKYYVATEFEKAESMLTDAIQGCRGQCSAAVIAKAWMYIGIVRGGGKNDQRGAKAAFLNALAADPNVALDGALATPKTRKTFTAAQRAKRYGHASGATEVEAGDEGFGEGGADAMDCLPKVSEVETRRPIPIWCTADESAVRVELHYQSGHEGWTRLSMKKKKGVFRATIPCQAVRRKGTLRFYVRSHDADGDPLDTFGKKANPIKIDIVRESDEEPPSFPDKKPPRRCSSEQAGPEGPASCDVDEDCASSGKCVDGKCGAVKHQTGPVKVSWLGMHVAYDLTLVSGDDVCSVDSQQNKGFACFYKDSDVQYRFNPQPNFNDKVRGGLAPATYRIFGSYDRLFGSNVSGGVRIGYAFGGGPPSGKDRAAKFLPYHGELRLSYWLGDAPFSRSGFRPYIGAEAGVAQVDTKLPVEVGDCGGSPGGPPSKPGDQIVEDPAFYSDCSNGLAGGPKLALDAYKKLGQGFVGVHGGVVYAFSRDSGIQLNLNIMQMMPTSGQVFEPSLGYVFGI
jgi:hypothetical protein